MRLWEAEAVAKRSRCEELNLFNAVACLLVVLIHVLSVGITELQRDTLQAAVVFFPWKLAAYVVPGFLFTGAVKMGLGFDDDRTTPRMYLSYMVRRILKIWLPYAVWVGIYYLYFLRIGWVEAGFGVFADYVIYGNLSSPFYYVVTVMQFYALMPFWKWMTKKIPCWIALPTAAMVTLGMLYSEGILSHMGIAFAWRDRVFPSYLVFWVLGLYAGRHYDTVRTALRQHTKAVAALLVPILLYAVGMWVQFAKGIYLFDGNVIKLFSDCMTIGVMLMLCIHIADGASECIKKPLNFIYRASFTVYLSHCLFLQIASSAISRFGIADIGVQLVVRAAVCYTAPFILWYLWSLIHKGIKILLAKRKAG